MFLTPFLFLLLLFITSYTYGSVWHCEFDIISNGTITVYYLVPVHTMFDCSLQCEM